MAGRYENTLHQSSEMSSQQREGLIDTGGLNAADERHAILIRNDIVNNVVVGGISEALVTRVGESTVEKITVRRVRNILLRLQGPGNRIALEGAYKIAKAVDEPALRQSIEKAEAEFQLSETLQGLSSLELADVDMSVQVRPGPSSSSESKRIGEDDTNAQKIKTAVEHSAKEFLKDSHETYLELANMGAENPQAYLEKLALRILAGCFQLDVEILPTSQVWCVD